MPALADAQSTVTLLKELMALIVTATGFIKVIDFGKAKRQLAVAQNEVAILKREVASKNEEIVQAKREVEDVYKVMAFIVLAYLFASVMQAMKA